jgi:hypothetical protein
VSKCYSCVVNKLMAHSLEVLDLGYNDLSGDLAAMLVPCADVQPACAATDISLDFNLFESNDLTSLHIPVLFPHLSALRIGPSDKIVSLDGTAMLDEFFALANLTVLQIFGVEFVASDAGERARIGAGLCGAKAIELLDLSGTGLAGYAWKSGLRS